MARVVIAGIVGGLLMFFAGAVEHMMFEWVGRNYSRVEDDQKAREAVGAHFPKPGLYSVPQMKKGVSADEGMKEHNERYRKGPNAMVIVAPSGEDAMGPTQLGGEAVTSIVGALIAAFLLSHVRPDVGFIQRWFLTFLLGPLTWVSVNASYFLWYRFPQAVVIDELFCAMLEWAVAGLVIAAIVKGKAPTAVQ